MRTEFAYSAPDTTYFTISDVAPKIDGDTIKLTNGSGKQRSWGTPQVTSTVVYESNEFIVVHIGFINKHARGQGWFYFVQTENGPERRTWSQLTQDEQDLVLSNLGKAPVWANSPGKRKSDISRKRPSESKFTAYKIVRMTDSGLKSLFDGTSWEIGKRNAQAVRGNAKDETHRGGYYVYTDVDLLKKKFRDGKLFADWLVKPGEYAVLECECSGRTVKYRSGKIAVTYCKPIAIVEVLTVK